MVTSDDLPLSVAEGKELQKQSMEGEGIKGRENWKKMVTTLESVGQANPERKGRELSSLELET